MPTTPNFNPGFTPNPAFNPQWPAQAPAPRFTPPAPQAPRPQQGRPSPYPMGSPFQHTPTPGGVGPRPQTWTQGYTPNPVISPTPPPQWERNQPYPINRPTPPPSDIGVWGTQPIDMSLITKMQRAIVGIEPNPYGWDASDISKVQLYITGRLPSYNPFDPNRNTPDKGPGGPPPIGRPGGPSSYISTPNPYDQPRMYR